VSSDVLDISPASLVISSIVLAMIGSGYLEISDRTKKIGAIVSASLICIVSSYISVVSLTNVVATIFLFVVCLRFYAFLVGHSFSGARGTSYSRPHTSEQESEESP